MSTVVGRDAELEAIAAFLAGGEGTASVMVLEGEAGIGKTTIWAEALGVAQGLGCRVLTARPLEAETRISFSAVDDLLTGALDEVLAALPDPQRRALEVALLLADPEGAPPESQAIAFAFLSALRLLARTRRTLVAVDDAQWLDEPSAALLAYAARRVGTEPLLLLFARRTAKTTGVAAVGLDDAIDQGGAERISLGPLSVGAMQRMLHEQLGDVFPRPVLHRIHATADGNPFHALELGRALVRRDADVVPGAPLPVPEDLGELVGERLAALPDSTARALQIAALSSEPTLSLLEAALGEPFDLAPAVAARVVTLEDDRVLFSHPLYSFGIAGNMSASTRRDVHRRLARLGGDPEEQAYHLALGSTEPDVEIAARLEAAARGARARGSPLASAELLEHALRLSRPSDAAYASRVIDAADAYFEAGGTGRALALLESVVGDLPAGVERAEVLYRLAVVRGELDTDVGPAVELYERALAEPGLQPPLAARIHSELAWLAIFAADVSYGLRQAERAVALTNGSDVPAARAEALTALSFIQAVAGRPTPERLLDAAVGLEAAGHRFRIDRCPSLVIGVRLAWSGELDAARTRFDSVLRLALERGDETNTSIARFHLAQVELQHGHIEQAVEHVLEARQLADQTGVNVSEVRLIGAAVDAHLGDVDGAISAATDVLADAERFGNRMNALRALAVLGFVELSRAQGLEASRYLDQALGLWHDLGLGEPGAVRFIPDAVEALAGTGRLDDATSVLTRFEEDARRLGHPWAAAAVDRCRGVVRAAADDPAGALADLERACAASERLPFPFERARTLLLLGGVQRRTQRRREARTSLAAALELFERLSAPLWADRARVELERIGGRAPSGLELTPHERHIAELVAAGGTNREVAAALFVTVHTIEAALTRIYGKVGVRSRTELASRIGELDTKL